MRPSTTPASISVHGAWQIAATGLACSKKARTNATASSSVRRKSGLATPPGSTSPSYSAASASATVRSTVNVSALSRWLNACTSPESVESSSGVPPASSTAFHGSVSSTCSMPSGATRKATRLPESLLGCHVPLLCLEGCGRAPRPGQRRLPAATRWVAPGHGLRHRRHRRAAARGRLRDLLRAQRHHAPEGGPGEGAEGRRPASPRPTSRRSATRPSTPGDRPRAVPRARAGRSRPRVGDPGPARSAERPSARGLAERSRLRSRAAGHFTSVALRGCPPLFRLGGETNPPPHRPGRRRRPVGVKRRRRVRSLP